MWFPHRVFGPPIEALALPLEDRKVCAGNFEVVYLDYRINRPGIVSAAEVIYDSETNAPVDNGNLVFGPVPFDEQTEAKNIPIGWTVPDLPPGKYYSVMGIYHENVESMPEFVRFYFEVVKCESDNLFRGERESR